MEATWLTVNTSRLFFMRMNELPQMQARNANSNQANVICFFIKLLHYTATGALMAG